MSFFIIVLYITIILYISTVFTFLLIACLSTGAKQNILDFFSSYLNIKIYYKQKNISKDSYLPLKQQFETFEIKTNQVSLLHYKANIKFAVEDLNRNFEYFPPSMRNNIFSKDVVVCPQYRELPDIEQFKLNFLIQRVQSDVRKMILENPHLLVKKEDDERQYPFNPPLENWSFDLFLPTESLPQHVQMGIIR